MVSSTSPSFDILEASISDHRDALDSGNITSVDLVIAYLLRIATYNINASLNAFTIFNPNVFQEAAASDVRRTSGLAPRPLEGIPYTIKDSYKYAGLTVTNGSPALEGLMSSEDSAIAKKLRDAGAVLIGKTNMPPMAAGGMQRGLYGRAESPYNRAYLTAAFSSGSSNGAATSTTANMAVFGMGSETVSSGRSPASNNALCCYTPSKGVLSCRGLWPLYVTCDVPVPYARSMSDLLDILSVIGEQDDEDIQGDFWREQTIVDIPWRQSIKPDYAALRNEGKRALKGKRIGVPKMYIGLQDSHPHAKHPVVHPDTIALWKHASADLEALGAEIIYTDFPLVTNYENDSVSGEANNVSGAPSDWNSVERTTLLAKAWDDFLTSNNDTKLKSLADIEDSVMLFPKPKNYIPDTFLEVRNWVDYAHLPSFAAKLKDISIYDLPGLKEALPALEEQRKRDLDEWMDNLKLDCIAFPAQGDIGFADLEFNLESTKHSLQNGVKYSNGNRAIRHLGVPTVSVPMGVLAGRQMPMNLTFAGKAYEDEKLLMYAYAYEQGSKRRIGPPLTPRLATDTIISTPGLGHSLDLTAIAEVTKRDSEAVGIRVYGTLKADEGVNASVDVYLDGEKAWSGRVDKESWETMVERKSKVSERLGWSLKPLPESPVMVLVVARSEYAHTAAKLLWAS